MIHMLPEQAAAYLVQADKRRHRTPMELYEAGLRYATRCTAPRANTLRGKSFWSQVEDILLADLVGSPTLIHQVEENG